MDQAKAALNNIGDGGGIGVEDAKTAIQAAMDEKGGAKGGEGGNPLAGMETKAKAAINDIGEQGVAHAKATGEDVKGAVEGAIGGLGKK